MVVDKTFREDFYYRIYVYPIILPPLRDRRMDIMPIAYHFLRQFSRSLGKSITGFEEQAAQRMTAFDWPGNVRQLRNAVERAVILCEGDRITLADLPIFGNAAEGDRLLTAVPQNNDELKQAKKEIRRKAADRVEKSFLLNALQRCDWNVSRAARETGLQRTNFHNMMKKHGILLPPRPPTG
jgi:DNA-binding NtrC family response regulator